MAAVPKTLTPSTRTSLPTKEGATHAYSIAFQQRHVNTTAAYVSSRFPLQQYREKDLYMESIGKLASSKT